MDDNEISNLKDDVNELAGRIEGVGKAFLLLAVAMEKAGTIDGPEFADHLRQAIQPSERSPSHLEVAQKTLLGMADALDESRERRQSSPDQ